MKLLTFCFFGIYLLGNINNNNFEIMLSVKHILLLIIALLIGLIIYKDEKKYNVEDAAYLFFTNVFLSLGFALLMTLREFNIYYLIIILLITITSDTFALVTGSLIGKNKLVSDCLKSHYGSLTLDQESVNFISDSFNRNLPQVPY